MEHVEILNNRKEKTGITRDRYKLEPDDFMAVVHLWMINDKGEILVQQRSSNKIENPDKWEVPGGAVMIDESSLNAVIRETKEELGVDINKENVELIGTVRVGHFFNDIWLIRENFSISEFDYPRDSIQEVKWVKLREFEIMLEDGILYSTSYFFLRYYLINVINKK